MKSSPSSGSVFLETHVARDVLAVAQEFTNVPKALWEYVANSLQYVEPNEHPVVHITVDKRKRLMEVQDNGRGMDEQCITNSFLVMHAPNVDRLSGRTGRGMWGTGKAAAFGVARTLTIRTVHDGLAYGFQISRDELEALQRQSSVTRIPVRPLEWGASTTERNGTLVRISEPLRSVRLDDKTIERVRAWIEKHLRRYPTAQVYVNGRPCYPAVIKREPAYDRVVPAPEDIATSGESKLELHVARESLDEDSRGVYAWITGQRLRIGLAGYEGNRYAPRIFGDIDADWLDPDLHPEWPPPFRQGRSEEPNADNPGVVRLVAWVGREIKMLIDELEQAEKERRDAEELRRLRRIGQVIASVLNEDYREQEERMDPFRGAGGGGNRTRTRAGDAGVVLVPGGEVPAMPASSAEVGAGTDQGGGGSNGRSDTEERVLQPDDTGVTGGREVRRQHDAVRPGGGFTIDFVHLGPEDDRARYAEDDRSILINVDHPQVCAARQAGEEMERLLYSEIAIAEYSFALAQRNVALEAGLAATAASRALVFARERLNCVARRLTRGGGS